jgi:rhamnopyranosyl-N-acetylglucosaminyl-diphospho-decaprenol beta-1,3/1,4-galactofuranosyltransferase
MNIIAIVVTYNRLTLLKKCLSGIKSQTHAPDQIVVINNGSTDGTELWLAEQHGVIAYHQPNQGGAGGFSRGIAEAYNRGADWIWIMDDDTIPKPDTLERLLAPLLDPKVDPAAVGFLSSKILWVDDSIHEMNRTYVLNDQKKLARLTVSKNDHLPAIQFGTFVSMLLSAKAVERVGLPIKEFFIWNDDVEYSKRIIKSGLAGLMVEDSIAVHETPINHLSSVFKDTHEHLWKYNHGLRNEMFTKRTHDGELQFWVTWVHRMFIMPFRIVINRKSHRWPFIKTIWRSSVKAINFRPAIDKIESRS